MVSELREFVDADKVIFGMRECLRNGKKLGRVFIASDTRHEMHDEIKKLGIEVEQIELSKKLCISFCFPKFHVCPLFHMHTIISQLFRKPAFLNLGTGFVLCQIKN